MDQQGGSRRTKKAKTGLDASQQAKRQKSQTAGAAAAGTAPGDQSEATIAANFKGSFAQDLIPMMYGFGDDLVPLQETVDLVEDIVIDYSVKMIHAALDSSVARERSTRGKNLPSIQAEDVLALVDQDPIKFGRVKELLMMQQEIETAKKSFLDSVEAAEQYGDA